MTDERNPGRENRCSTVLSARLQAVADLVSPGCCLADIGTDHAYVPIWLILSGRIPKALAADVNQGPLLKALEHIRDNNVGDKVETRLSDGFQAIKPGEVSSAVLAGMGGGLMIRILREGACTVENLKECILQPQSEIEKVRAFLLQEGFLFLEEDMVEEDGKYYPMMKVRPPRTEDNGRENQGALWSEVQLRYGKLLLEKKNSVLREFLEREIRIKKKILSRLDPKDSPRIAARRREVEKELKCAEKGLRYYAVQ